MGSRSPSSASLSRLGFSSRRALPSVSEAHDLCDFSAVFSVVDVCVHPLTQAQPGLLFSTLIEFALGILSQQSSGLKAALARKEGTVSLPLEQRRPAASRK